MKRAIRTLLNRQTSDPRSILWASNGVWVVTGILSRALGGRHEHQRQGGKHHRHHKKSIAAVRLFPGECRVVHRSSILVSRCNSGWRRPQAQRLRLQRIWTSNQEGWQEGWQEGGQYSSIVGARQVATPAGKNHPPQHYHFQLGQTAIRVY